MTQSTVKPPRSNGATKRAIWDLKWIREPQQTRSAKTRAKLLDAAEKLIASEGMQGVTVVKVTKLARSSVGSFYHYFQDKEALIYSVFERINAEASATAMQGLDPEVWAEVPLIEIIEGYLRYSLKNSKQRAGITQAQNKLEAEDPHFAERLQKYRKEIREAILNLLIPKLDQIDHEEPRKAVEITLEIMRGMLNQRSLSYAPGSPPAYPKMSEEAFIREMRQVAESYLQVNTTS